MGQERLRGPSPDDPEEQLNQLKEMLIRIGAEAAARATTEVRAINHEGQKNPWLQIGLTVLSTVLSGLILWFISSLSTTIYTIKTDVATQKEVTSAQQAQITHQQQQIDWLMQRTK